MPIVYVYGDGAMYCVDVVFSNANKVFTQPEVVGKLLIHRPHQVQFEANNGGTEYAQAIDVMLRAKGCVLNISTRRAARAAHGLSHRKLGNCRCTEARVLTCPDIIAESRRA